MNQDTQSSGRSRAVTVFGRSGASCFVIKNKQMVGLLPGSAMSSADRRRDCQVLRDELLETSALPIVSRELAYQPPGDSCWGHILLCK